jgi:hypothetical protein
MSVDGAMRTGVIGRSVRNRSDGDAIVLIAVPPVRDVSVGAEVCGATRRVG